MIIIIMIMINQHYDSNDENDIEHPPSVSLPFSLLNIIMSMVSMMIIMMIMNDH